MKKSGDSFILPVLIVYVIIFYSIWIVWEFWGRGIIDTTFGDSWLSQLVKSGLIKNLVWTLPAILLICRFKSNVYINLKEMFSTKVNWLKYLPVFIAFTIWVLAGSVLNNASLKISSDFGIDKIIIVLFVGLTEETVFRGWLLNATIREDKRWLYIALNAIMFLAIHFPSWILTDVFVANFINLVFLGILALSVIFSITFIKSRNIFAPIALHMYWDLLVFMFL